MKRILIFASMAAALLIAGCCPKSAGDGIIRTEVPERPAGQQDMLGFAADPIETVRIGFVGLGMRGRGAIRRYVHLEGVEIAALCDMNAESVERCQKYLTDAGLPEAVAFSGDPEAYKKLCEMDLDLVYICTDWAHHVPVALCAMENGKHTVIEVPAATSLDEIWALINTSERTRKHCMMLENCCYDFYEMTALNMAQHGLFGEIIHAEGSYHHCLDPFWAEYWNNWRLEFNRTHKGDIYPTHGFGPVCQALNIHRGDQLKTLVAMETSSRMGAQTWKKVRGEELEGEFANGDLTMTMISTKLGKTIQIQHDVMTPHPYNRMYQLVGTKGYASKYPVEGFSFEPEQLPETIDHENLDADSFVSDEVREQLMEEYKPAIVKEIGEYAKKVGGHGGMDFIMDYRLIYCLHHGLPLDMDVYDLAEWCCISELGAISIEHGSAPVEVPDFTRGGQDKIKGFSYAYAE